MKSFGLGLALGATMIISANAQLVTNGGFETGSFAGWTVSTTSSDPWQIDTSSSGNGSGHGPHSGTFFASTGCVGSQCIGSDSLSTTAYLYEDLSTVVGDTYQVDFFFASGGNNSPQELLATFGGTTFEDLVNLPAQSPGYTEYTRDVLATSTTSRLEFQGRQDPGWNALDDVSVTDLGAAATPEPTTAFLGLGTSLLGLAVLRRKRTR